MTDRVSCINYDYRNKTCRSLERGIHCEPDECPFYKSIQDSYESNEYVFKRLASLPMWKQEHISEKYYYGKMPWNEV